MSNQLVTATDDFTNEPPSDVAHRMKLLEASASLIFVAHRNMTAALATMTAENLDTGALAGAIQSLTYVKRTVDSMISISS